MDSNPKICKGSWALGTACGKCPKCFEEGRALMKDRSAITIGSPENAIVKDSAHPGGLYNLSTYIHWLKSDETARLDSEFTAEDLRAIADYMDEHYEPEGDSHEV